MEDKYFWVFRIDNVKGDLLEKVEEGENIWMTEEEIRSITNIFATFDEMIEVLDSDCLVYKERYRLVDQY